MLNNFLQIEDCAELQKWNTLLNMLDNNLWYAPFEQEIIYEYNLFANCAKSTPHLDDLISAVTGYLIEQLYDVIYIENQYDTDFIKGWSQNYEPGDNQEYYEDYVDDIVNYYIETFLDQYHYKISDKIEEVLYKSNLTYLVDDTVYIQNNNFYKCTDVIKRQNAAQQVFFETEFSFIEEMAI